ncbi:MAG: copper oxidase [Anaerolineales bacterium]|nr:MAG: copper oxidase [Anaerolineales bacterium]
MIDRVLPRPLLWLLATAFRLLPWPTRTGLRRVGRPRASSPVILTGNFALTVDRVLAAMRGVDAWLLVANSRGLNVWCASAGGHLTTHDVISILKTSGVAENVTHRQVVLPQLAAAGVEADQVLQRTGWEVIWGPVDACHLPVFLERGGSDRMRLATFGAVHRLEMACMWAAPLSLLVAVAAFLWPAGALPLMGMIWGLTLAVYLGFPLYESLVARGSFVRFVALFGALAMAGTALVGALTGDLSIPFLLRWTGIGTAVVLLLGVDLAGSTPLYKSWVQPERQYRVDLSEELCTACGRCAEVCPRGVFVIAGVASLPRAHDCEQCAACIVQCPEDALSFAGPAGERVGPDIVRRHKLNMLGRRARTPSA